MGHRFSDPRRVATRHAISTKFHGVVEDTRPDNIAKTRSLGLQRLGSGVRVNLPIGASWVSSTSVVPMTTKFGRLIELVEAKLTLSTACRYVNLMGRYGASKIFVGQALQTGNGDRFCSWMAQTIEQDGL